MNDTKMLFRRFAPEELALIRQGGIRAFPPRLPDQPIFYPVLSEDYAVQNAGGIAHLEYWIPTEDLPAFNDAIVGPIEVVAEFF